MFNKVGGFLLLTGSVWHFLHSSRFAASFCQEFFARTDLAACLNFCKLIEKVGLWCGGGGEAERGFTMYVAKFSNVKVGVQHFRPSL